MPHQCTNCGRPFPDGSKEMLSGCPNCGGNKFQFQPSGESAFDSGSTSASSPASASTSGAASSSASASTTVSAEGTVSSGDATPTSDATGSKPPRDGRDSASASGESRSQELQSNPSDAGTEDSAQAKARSDMVGPDELPSESAQSPAEGRVVDTPDDERPGLAQLREELNEQFESIKILEPGQYELNLMGLYDREEYIIALEENGRYVIEVPDAWHS